MVNKDKKGKKISVRLDPEATKKLDEAKEKGYTISQFINRIIKGSSVGGVDIGSMRTLMVSMSNLQSQLEFEDDVDVRKNMREELNKICQVLKSFHSPT